MSNVSKYKQREILKENIAKRGRKVMAIAHRDKRYQGYGDNTAQQSIVSECLLDVMGEMAVIVKISTVLGRQA